ncbi:MAG: HDOD domain-containing protein [bacterium]|nr:HDOD domain-containing protein [bacterium]
MSAHESSGTGQAAVAVARKAIFDQQRHLWGYELFCVGNTDESPTGIPVAEDVPVSVAASTGVGLQQLIARQLRVMVALSEKSVLDDRVYALPPACTTVLINEGTFSRSGVAARLEQLKGDGFAVAVPDFTAHRDCGPLYRQADIIGVTVAGRTPAELGTLLAEIGRFGALPMASHVPDSECVVACRDLGFRLFQGPFSKEPEIVRLRRVSSGQIARFNLLKLIGSDDPDLGAIATEIQGDATVSFRLLTYLNSASFGLANRVNSISQAVSLLGWRRVRTWLRVVLLSDIGQTAAMSELLRLASQRARFLEVIATRYAFWGFDPESMHLLGLFSLLDAMMGIPMREVVGFLPLDSSLKAALCDEPNSEYVPLLQLVKDLEDARWAEVDAAARRLNLDAVGVREAFLDAATVAGDLDVMAGAG